jgi:C-terminal processing protease CtpA/Prc
MRVAAAGTAAPYCGIGLFLERGAKGCLVAGIERGSAAEQSGQISVGDFFLKVHATPAAAWTLQQLRTRNHPP